MVLSTARWPLQGQLRPQPRPAQPLSPRPAPCQQAAGTCTAKAPHWLPQVALVHGSALWAAPPPARPPPDAHLTSSRTRQETHTRFSPGSSSLGAPPAGSVSYAWVPRPSRPVRASPPCGQPGISAPTCQLEGVSGSPWSAGAQIPLLLPKVVTWQGGRGSGPL